jgi:hypothetical protein
MFYLTPAALSGGPGFIISIADALSAFAPGYAVTSGMTGIFRTVEDTLQHSMAARAPWIIIFLAFSPEPDSICNRSQPLA